MRTSISLLALLAVSACAAASSTTSSDVADDVASVEEEAINATGLAALLDVTNSGENAAAFATALTAFEEEAMELELDIINNSRFDALPVVGSSDYAGFVRVNAGPTADLGAQIDLTANFAENGQIAGDITSPFFAATEDGLVEYEDDVAVVFGATRSRGQGNTARVDLEGTISNETNTVVVDAIIEGRFIGTPIVGARGEVNVGDQFGSGDNAVDALSLTLNGEAVGAGSVGFVVLNDE